MIKLLKSLGFTEYKLDEIPFCYEIEFPLLNKGLAYYKFSDTTKINVDGQTIYKYAETDTKLLNTVYFLFKDESISQNY